MDALLLDDLQVLTELETPGTLVTMRFTGDCELKTESYGKTKREFSFVDIYPCKWEKGEWVDLGFLSYSPNDFKVLRASGVNLGMPVIEQERVLIDALLSLQGLVAIAVVMVVAALLLYIRRLRLILKDFHESKSVSVRKLTETEAQGKSAEPISEERSDQQE